MKLIKLNSVNHNHLSISEESLESLVKVKANTQKAKEEEAFNKLEGFSYKPVPLCCKKAEEIFKLPQSINHIHVCLMTLIRQSLPTTSSIFLVPPLERFWTLQKL